MITISKILDNIGLIAAGIVAVIFLSRIITKIVTRTFFEEKRKAKESENGSNTSRETQGKIKK